MSFKAYCPTCDTVVEAQETYGMPGMPFHLTKERGYYRIHDCRMATSVEGTPYAGRSGGGGR